MNEKTLTKVIFEYSDGTKAMIAPDYLKTWQDNNAVLANFARIHRCNPFDKQPLQIVQLPKENARTHY